MVLKSVKKTVSTSIEVDGFLQKAAVSLRNEDAGGLAKGFWRQHGECRRLTRRGPGLCSVATDAAELRSRSGRTAAGGGRRP